MVERNTETGSCLVIAATFTAEPMQPALEFLLREAGLKLEVNFAPYHQVLPELISTASMLAANRKGVNVVLVRLEDVVRDIADCAKALELIDSTADEIVAALGGFVGRCKTPTILSVFEASPHARTEIRGAIREACARLLAKAASLPGIAVLTPGDIDAVAAGECYDDDSNDLAHIPFTESHYAAIALALARKVHAFLVPDRKVLVLDCDNTIWRGVVGEDGVDGITIPPALAAVQKFAVAIQAKGVLVCLASKNVEHDVIEVFERRSDMLLKLDHVVAHRINWEPKPHNIAALARELNLGLDSFVFIDDNPVECELMRTELPQVLTLLLPPDDEIDAFLSHLWVFDKVTVTEEDARRTNMYKEDVARKQLEKGAVDIVDFVSSLQVKVDIGSPDETEWPRLAQLSQRTNQFNFTTVRRTEAELRAFGRHESGGVLRVRVSDRFGDYGLVGLVIFRTNANDLVVDTFLLSCRVLGRGVEHAILRHLGELAKQSGLPEVVVPFSRSARNEPAWAFAESVAAQYKSKEGALELYRIPTATALTILHRPGQDPEAVIRARDSETKKVVPQLVSLDLAGRYTMLSRQLLTGQDVLTAAMKANARKRDLPGVAVMPGSEKERQMLALWQEVLGISDLGVEDDYAAAGGTSLLAARLFAGITQRFGVKLPLTTILEYSTVRQLAGLMDSPAETLQSLISLRPKGSRNVFLVHDGDGETLLYMNIARRLPLEFAVFGIEPSQLPNIPLAHTRIEDMANFCIDVMRRKQPEGPYILGGMCAGGVIAYEMARQLEARGETVERVILLDAALPGAAKRQGRITKQRMSRLTGLFEESNKPGALQLSLAIARKLRNAAVWEVRSRFKRWSVRAGFGFLHFLLERQRAWPGFIPPLTVRHVYDSAESRYRAPATSLPVLLVRARAGEGGDTPFREIYVDETLGWTTVVPDLLIEDVDGGHFSMLQEPFAEAVARKIADHLKPEADVIELPPKAFRKVSAA